ncbi:MAG: hypothetical protein WCS51_00355 [Bacilli bacterium]
MAFLKKDKNVSLTESEKMNKRSVKVAIAGALASIGIGGVVTAIQTGPIQEGIEQQMIASSPEIHNLLANTGYTNIDALREALANSSEPLSNALRQAVDGIMSNISAEAASQAISQAATSTTTIAAVLAMVGITILGVVYYRHRAKELGLQEENEAEDSRKASKLNLNKEVSSKETVKEASL